MNLTYEPADIVQVYFKVLQDAQTILMYLQDKASEKVLICQVIKQFNNHTDLN